MGAHKVAYNEQITNFNFLVIFNLKSALCVSGEYADQQNKPEKLTYLT
jgi:hypothetical protein